MSRDFRALDDRDLLSLSRSDAEAFATFYSRHSAEVLAYFSRAVGRADLAVDLTGETFAAVLTALPDYRPTTVPARAWLYAIARNRLIDSLRRGQSEARAEAQLKTQATISAQAGEGPLERLIARADEQSALILLQELPVDQRHAIIACASSATWTIRRSRRRWAAANS